jgi:hypothetical protein
LGEAGAGARQRVDDVAEAEVPVPAFDAPGFRVGSVTAGSTMKSWWNGSVTAGPIVHGEVAVGVHVTFWMTAEPSTASAVDAGE